MTDADNKANISSKSQLAKLLAQENILVRHIPSARTASFNMTDRVLNLPIWKDMPNFLYDMLIIHEVGHALDTPHDWHKYFPIVLEKAGLPVTPRNLYRVQGFLNVLEDVRIDKRQKRRYPGSRFDYVKGYAKLHADNFFNIHDKNINKSSFIDRVNVYYKGGVSLNIAFTKKEKELLTRIGDTETFDQVVDLCTEVLLFAKDQISEMLKQYAETLKADASEPDESDEDDYSDDEDSEGEDSDGASNYGKGGGADDQGEVDDTEDFEEADEDVAEDQRGGGNHYEDNELAAVDDEEEEDTEDKEGIPDDPDDFEIPEPETQVEYDRLMQGLAIVSEARYTFFTVPTPILKNIIVDYKEVQRQQNSYIGVGHSDYDKGIAQFRKNEEQSISFMINEFEMKKAADVHLRTKVSKTGVLDTNKLFSYRFNDDIFRRIQTVAEGKNHGFIFYIDWSSSMRSGLLATVKQLISLTMFCRQTNIPFEVYSFIDSDTKEKQWSEKGHEIYFYRQFALRNQISSRMNVAEYNNALRNLWIMGQGVRVWSDVMVGTPLNEALACAPEMVRQFQARTRVQTVNVVVLTDGDSNSIAGIHPNMDEPPIQLGYGKNRRHIFILQDNVTKVNYEVAPGSDELTTSLLKIIREQTGCNLIGFFLSRKADAILKFYGYHKKTSPIEYAKLSDQWNKDGFFAITTAGYDKYFVTEADNLDIQNVEMNITSNMTRNRLVKEFNKYAEKKTVNRLLLRSVIKEVTK